MTLRQLYSFTAAEMFDAKFAAKVSGATEESGVSGDSEGRRRNRVGNGLGQRFW